MLLPIFLIVLVDVFALTLVIPLLAIYSEELGATPLQATLLVSIFAACQLISGPILGRISDRIGRKPMLILSQLGTCAGLLVMAGARSLWMLYLGRIIDGATAGNLSLAQAYIADHTAPENRAKSFALIGIAFGLGFFLGPAITGHLAGYGLRAPILAAAGLSFTSVLCTATLLPGGPVARAVGAREGLPAGERLGVFEWGGYAQFFSRPVLAGILLEFFLFSFAFTTFTSGFALFAERTFTWKGKPFAPREIGYLFAYAGFLGIVLQGGLIGRLVKRFGEPRLVVAGFASMACGFLLLMAAHHIAPLIVVTTLVAFGHGVLRPAMTSLLTREAHASEQGVVLGLSQSLSSIAQIIAPALGGAVLGAGAVAEWPLAAAIAAGLGLAATRWGSARSRFQLAADAGPAR